jgi:hypothetical protein
MWVAVLSLYCLAAAMGGFARFHDAEGAMGVSTLLLVPLCFHGVMRLNSALEAERTLGAIAALIAWLLFASILARDINQAVLNGLSLCAYLALAACAYAACATARSALAVLLCLMIGALVSSSATLLDFAGLVQLSSANVREPGTHTDLGTVAQATGVFARRSAMGAYYVIAITAGLLLGLFGSRLSWYVRGLGLMTAITCCIALLLTHTRAALLSPALVIVFAMLCCKGHFWTRATVLLTLITCLQLIVLAATVMSPDVWLAYSALLRTGIGTDTNVYVADSDAARWVFFLHAVTHLPISPLGNGFSLLSDVPGYVDDVDPHNIITLVVWGAGLFGVAWLCWAVSAGPVVVRRFRLSIADDRAESQVILALLGSGCAFLINCMAHQSVLTGVAWIVFGVGLRLCRVHPVPALRAPDARVGTRCLSPGPAHGGELDGK